MGQRKIIHEKFSNYCTKISIVKLSALYNTAEARQKIALFHMKRSIFMTFIDTIIITRSKFSAFTGRSFRLSVTESISMFITPLKCCSTDSG